ncbi:FkbM family methyltransferase [Ruegeria sp. HKCCD6428]|uniref:FkbM family methyltransferase n=1 Tax=Ruegeria sp. HKCCD6428 TaxID=2683002 RepID=UPI001491B3A2|nr:FkbM family methyltransferase [Ruegeria sp. HKCCD6428]NOC85839.1 FkbM family methyltransferase [Ruegeria sp. HKCCD6428]
MQSERNILERLLFRPSNGRPIRALRRVLFHTNGKPRGVFRNWILESDGSPKHPFRQWMNSPDYLMLPWPASQHPGASPEPATVASNETSSLSEGTDISAPFEPFVQSSDLVISRGAAGGYWITHRSDAVIGWSMRQEGRFQEQAIDDVIQMLRENGHDVATSCFVDIGANIGSHSMHAARRGFDRVIAFEPDPQNFRLLRANALLHDVEHKVTCHQMAVSNRNGTMQMELSPSNFGDHRLRVSDDTAANLHDEGDWNLQDVPVRTFDSLVQDGLLPENGPDLIWVDTQGHEGHVLSCAQSLTRMRCPVVLEFWPYGLERSGGYKMLRDARVTRRRADHRPWCLRPGTLGSSFS